MSYDELYWDEVMAYVDDGYSIKEAKELAANEVKKICDFIDEILDYDIEKEI